jgi:translation initiation factor 2 subunit 1
MPNQKSLSSTKSSESYPEPGELVLATVRSIFRQGAFVTLDEYGNKRGLLHLSEISLKWVRNIRDYVKEGQKVVLMVLRVNPSRGHIDLSLRRVKDHDRKEKLKEVKQKQRAEKLLDLLAKNVNKPRDEIEKEVSQKILAKFETIYEGLEAISVDEETLQKLNISKEFQSPLLELIRKSIKLPFVEINGYAKIISYEPNGIEIIKQTLEKIENYNDTDEAKINVSYVSAPIYSVKVKAREYKIAERILREAVEKGINYIKKHRGFGEFHRKLEEKKTT